MNQQHNDGATVRHVNECPHESLEGIKMVRVLDGLSMFGVGCEYVVLEQGQNLDVHVHKKASSFILILDGRGIVVLNDVEHIVEKGHTIFIPAGVAHGFLTPYGALTLYGFQTPPIIRDAKDVDIFFRKDGHQGQLERARPSSVK